MRTQMLLRSGLVAAAVLVTGCGHTGTGATGSPSKSSTPSGKAATGHHAKPPSRAVKPEKPAPVENNPPGDIPDNTAFVPYRSAKGRFVIKVPEGWARRNKPDKVAFMDKLNLVEVTWGPSNKPSVASAKKHDVPQLTRTVPAFQLEGVEKRVLPGGSAILITYRANSRPNSVTGKKYRLDVLRFEFYKHGEEADLTLSSPVGADNVDPWRIISESFQWV